jgi:hypothetical protein
MLQKLERFENWLDILTNQIFLAVRRCCTHVEKGVFLQARLTLDFEAIYVFPCGSPIEADWYSKI